MKQLLFTIALMFAMTISKAQSPMQFAGLDCNGNAVDLFADLDAGKAVILHFYMPSCGSCPPPAQKIQAMANKINALNPGMVKGYAFPYQNSTTCGYSSNWVSSNGLGTLYAPMDSGAAHVANYGGFGMPTVVLLGGSSTNRRVLFSTLSFSNSDTTIMRDSILNLLSTTGLNKLNKSDFSFNVFPNPASDFVSINLELKEIADLVMDITDLTGKHVALITEEKSNGFISKQFNTAHLPNGNYLLRINVNGISSIKKLTINH